MRKFTSILILAIALVGSVSAQSLDDLRKKAYDLAIEAINEGKNRKSAYEEYLERQEIEAAKKAEEEKKAEAEDEAEDEDEYWHAIDILNRCVFCIPINENIFVKCYCYPIEDFVWYRAFLGTDGKVWVNIFYDDNGEIGEVFYASAMQEEEPTSITESTTGIKSPALKVTFTNGNLLFIQDPFDPYRFSITW